MEIERMQKLGLWASNSDIGCSLLNDTKQKSPSWLNSHLVIIQKKAWKMPGKLNEKLFSSQSEQLCVLFNGVTGKNGNFVPVATHDMREGLFRINKFTASHSSLMEHVVIQYHRITQGMPTSMKTPTPQRIIVFEAKDHDGMLMEYYRADMIVNKEMEPIEKPKQQPKLKEPKPCAKAFPEAGHKIKSPTSGWKSIPFVGEKYTSVSWQDH